MSNDRQLVTCIHSHEYLTLMWGQCPTCQGIDNRRVSDRTGVAIRALKAAMEAGHESDARAARMQLRELGHPDIDGLCSAVQARLDAAAAKGGAGKRERINRL